MPELKRSPLNVTVSADMLSFEGRQLVFVDDVVIGHIKEGRFVQRISRRHLFRELNSKGIEFDVYQRLLHEPVQFWRLEFQDTGEIVEIPFRQIPECGILNPRHSAGYQYHVKMRFFNVVRSQIQKEMFKE